MSKKDLIISILVGILVGMLIGQDTAPAQALDDGSLKTITAAILTRGWGFNSVDDEMRIYKAILTKI